MSRERLHELEGAPVTRSRIGLFASIGVAIVLAGLVFVLFNAEPATTRKADSPLLGKLAPDLVGDDYDLVDNAGQWVLVNFFATWCTPCIEEHDDLVAFSNAHASTGDASVVSVIFSDTPDNVEAFFEENGGDWPVVLDGDGRIATDWGVARVPESYLVAPDGQVRAKIIGGIDAGKLEQLLAEAKASEQ
jgi:cytochrome c biogenesis protein CcmG/thiol:disulfide interchange protein DsbE